jgi:hypothetical protein
MGRLGGVPGQIPAHPTVPQLPVSASPPLLPEIAAKSTPGPRVELLERGCRFRLAKIRTPAIEILAPIPPHPRQRHTPSALRPPTDLRLEPLAGFPAHRAPVRPAPREANPQERSPPWPVPRTLGARSPSASASGSRTGSHLPGRAYPPAHSAQGCASRLRRAQRGGCAGTPTREARREPNSAAVRRSPRAPC